MAFSNIEPQPMPRTVTCISRRTITKFNPYEMGFLFAELIGSFSLHNHPSTYPKSIILTKGRSIAIIEEITRKFVQKVPRNSNEAEIKHLGELEHEKGSMLRYGGLGHEIEWLSRISSPNPCLGRLRAFQDEQSPSSIRTKWVSSFQRESDHSHFIIVLPPILRA